jgi:hypothetical protein
MTGVPKAPLRGSWQRQLASLRYVPALPKGIPEFPPSRRRQMRRERQHNARDLDAPSTGSSSGVVAGGSEEDGREELDNGGEEWDKAED